MKTHGLALVIATITALSVTQLCSAQQRRSSQSNRSSKRVTRVGGHNSSQGTVRYHRSDSSESSRSRTTSRDSKRRDSGNRGVSDRSTNRTRDVDNRRDWNRSDRQDKSYYSGHTRYRAGNGSLSYRRSYNRPTQLPSYPNRHDVRVRRYPRYGLHITQLPSYHRTVSYRGHRYYFCDGVYYRSYGNVYRVVRPPVGFSLTYLPDGFVTVYFGGQRYYRYQNTYYVDQIVDNEPAYVVVQPPDQVIVDYLPPDSREVYYKGRLYYVDIYEETAYAPVIVDGYTRYRLTDLDVDVDYDDGRLEIEIDD